MWAHERRGSSGRERVGGGGGEDGGSDGGRDEPMAAAARTGYASSRSAARLACAGQLSGQRHAAPSRALQLSARHNLTGNGVAHQLRVSIECRRSPMMVGAAFERVGVSRSESESEWTTVLVRIASRNESEWRPCPPPPTQQSAPTTRTDRDRRRTPRTGPDRSHRSDRADRHLTSRGHDSPGHSSRPVVASHVKQNPTSTVARMTRRAERDDARSPGSRLSTPVY